MAANANLGRLISEHRAKGTALVSKFLTIVIMLLIAVMAVIGFSQASDEVTVGVPKIVLLLVPVVLLVAALFQGLQLMRLRSISYRIYENGIERIRGGETKSWLYSEFSSVLPIRTIYRFMYVIPLGSTYSCTVLGSSRSSTIILSIDYTNVKEASEFLMQKLPKFSYAGYGS